MGQPRHCKRALGRGLAKGSGCALGIRLMGESRQWRSQSRLCGGDRRVLTGQVAQQGWQVTRGVEHAQDLRRLRIRIVNQQVGEAG